MQRCRAVQATMHAALSAHMKRATEDAHKPLPASIRWFGKLCVAYGSALVALLVSSANLHELLAKIVIMSWRLLLPLHGLTTTLLAGPR